MFCHPEDFDLTVYPIKKGDILEIDSFEELCELDTSYRNYKKQEFVKIWKTQKNEKLTRQPR